VGKSHVGNTILGKLFFPSGNKSVSGMTVEMKMAQNAAFNNAANQIIRFIDMPGFGDPNLPLEKFAQQILQSLTADDKIDAVVIVTKATDYRLSLQEMIALRAIKKFMKFI
jgi:predicted GTPase